MIEPRISPGLGQRPLPQGKVRLAARLRVSRVLSLSEREFSALVHELEEDPLFKSLAGREGGRRIITHAPAPRASLSPRFYEELPENLPSTGPSFDVEGFASRREAALRLIRRVGRARFEENFLYGISSRTLSEAAAECGLSDEELRTIADFVTEFSARAEFFSPSGLSGPGTIHYTLIGQVVKEKDWSVAYFSPRWARGHYVLDETGLKKWIKESGLGREGKARLKRLLDRINLVNLRRDAFSRVLNRALDRQADYLETGEESRMSPVSAEAVARELSLSPSTVSRAVHGRSLRLPWGLEVPVSHLLPGRHKVLVRLVEGLLARDPGGMTDEELARAVYKNYGLKASRRSINVCRHEILGERK